LDVDGESIDHWDFYQIEKNIISVPDTRYVSKNNCFYIHMLYISIRFFKAADVGAYLKWLHELSCML
jgi:hypothetical protein